MGVTSIISARYIPSPPLNSYIEHFYYLVGPAPYPRQKVLPAASLNVMLNLGHPFRVYEPEQAEPFVTCTESWGVGLWSTYHTVDWPLNVRFFGIYFRPGGAYPFLHLPLSELNSQVVALDAIWGNFAAEMRERLYVTSSIQAGFDLLERLLLARLWEQPHGLDIVQYAIAAIARQHGALSIKELSDAIGISQNHLGTHFKRMVGVPPKAFARFYRFAHVLLSIDSAQPVDWTRIAHETGFYDQPHFNKDFVAFTGHNPTNFLRLRRRVYNEHPEFAQDHGNLPID